MAYPYRCSTLCPQLSLPPVADYIWWRDVWCTNTAPYAQKSLPLTSHSAVGHTTRNGDAVNDRFPSGILLRPCRGRAATCLHAKTRLARGRGSLSLGTYDAPTSCIPPKCYKMPYLFCDMHSLFWEVSGWPATTAKDNAPVEEQQPAPVRRQDVLVERTVWAWEHMIHQQAIHYRSYLTTVE